MRYLWSATMVLILLCCSAQAASPVMQQPMVTTVDSVTDLPLVELGVKQAAGDYFIIILSGDGGWADIDQALAESFNNAGIPVAGFNSLKYFWTYKSPDQSAADLARIIRHYSSIWAMGRVALVGFSRGADVLPFMINRLPDDMKKRVLASALLAAEPQIEFQFKVTDWLPGGGDTTSLPVVPEVEKLAGTHLVCIYGSEETSISICPDLDQTSFKVIELKGGHHFNGDYQQLALELLDHFNTARRE